MILQKNFQTIDRTDWFYGEVQSDENEEYVSTLETGQLVVIGWVV